MRTLRIGNGCGFWGDNVNAPLQLVRSGQLDYLTLEYLAELTMSILALLRQRDPNAGYATDFLDVLESLIPELRHQPKLKIITNAGGMNPLSCAQKSAELLRKHNLTGLRIGVVSGDDLLPNLDALLAAGHELKHLDTGEPLSTVRSRVVSANAYLGSVPISQALEQGANVVITGRVADACLTVGPLLHEFGWNTEAWDLLAAGSSAGHLIECGAQVTGGLWINAAESTRLGQVGYPIAEIREDGVFRITKPAGSGGAVNQETVSEQLLYEVADPARYYTPDVVADFTTPKLSQLGPDVIEVTGCRGTPATPTYKVSIAYRDGFTSSGMLVIVGPDAVRKARLSGAILLERLRNAGFDFENSLIEVLGAGDVVRGVLPSCEPPEVVLRVAVRDPRKAAVERFAREFAPLVTAGLPGTTGYTTGRPVVREVFAYWPALIHKSAVTPLVQLLEV
jgi:hypothetical protein